MRLRNIKPIFLMYEEGISDLEKRAVLDGMCDLLEIAGVDLDFKDYGVWRGSGYVHGSRLVDFKSVDWYLQEGMRTSRNRTQLNVAAILESFIVEPWRESQDHYDIMITYQDIYAESNSFLVGAATQTIGTVISVNRFRKLDHDIKYECIKTETMHELGHVFGIPSLNRTIDIEDNIGKHCTNICIMRQGINVPSDWIDLTNDRLENDALCGICERELINYFRG